MKTSRHPWTLLPALITLAACADAAGSDPAAFNPCEEGPVLWTIGDVDPRFGIGEAAVKEAVEAAIAVWESPGGNRFFQYAPDDGMPVHLAYDERQEHSAAIRRDQARLASLHGEIEALRRDLEARASWHRRDLDDHRLAAARLQDEIESLNAEVGRINRRGRPSAAEARRIDRERSRLRAARIELERREAALLTTQQELERGNERLNALIEENNLLADRLRGSSGTLTESALHESTITTRRGRRTAREHSITVFQFEGADHLTLILAHELGHALGLGHVDHEEAIMGEVHDAATLRTPIAAHPEDQRALDAQCRT